MLNSETNVSKSACKSSNKYESEEKIARASDLVKNITMPGLLPEEEKIAVLKASKVFVFPSYEEGFGIAILEAMACGLPVVAYDLPAYKVFGNDCIIKVPVGNKKAFSEVIKEFLLNERLRLEAGNVSKKIASRFNWDKIVGNELKVISKTDICEN